jgi:hypothetical protein
MVGGFRRLAIRGDDVQVLVYRVLIHPFVGDIPQIEDGLPVLPFGFVHDNLEAIRQFFGRIDSRFRIFSRLCDADMSIAHNSPGFGCQGDSGQQTNQKRNDGNRGKKRAGKNVIGMYQQNR